MAQCIGVYPQPVPSRSPCGSDVHCSCSLYTNKLLLNLHSLWQSEYFCDVELAAGNYIVKAHRAVLSAASSYFQAMFTGGLIEEKQTLVELKSLTPSTLSQMINFIYTGNINVNIENVQDLIVAADMLQLSEIVHICTSFLKRELTASNCIGIYRFCEAHHLSEMQEATRDFIQSNFPEVVNEEEFLETPKEILLSFLKSEYLRVDNEFQIFSAAMRWIQHNVTSRRRHVFEILNHVRMPLISQKSLENYIADCWDISLKVALTSIQKDLNSKRGSLVPLTVQPRLCARRKIYVIGGSKRELISNWTRSEYTYESVECFDTFQNTWHKVTPMDIGRILPGTAVLNGRIYVVGGEQESQILANGEVYDPQEDAWKSIASMVIPRCEFGLCAFENYIYAFGGWVGEDIGGSIEKYNVATNEWNLVGKMPEPRFSMGVVVHKGLIYIVGGCTHNQRHLQDLLHYNPITGEWDHLAPMLTRRSQMGVAVLDGFLYVVGGTNSHCEILNSVERYSFEENKWHECPPMSVGRASPAVAAANSRLYVIGGDQINEANDFYRAQVTISHVEAYDPQIDSWIDCAPLPESRSESGAVVI
ncbi:UNVERIFIED_CONTAM: hypothetical protein RMT77_000618 [Armadillidium vulgare]